MPAKVCILHHSKGATGLEAHTHCIVRMDVEPPHVKDCTPEQIKALEHQPAAAETHCPVCSGPGGLGDDPALRFARIMRVIAAMTEDEKQWIAAHLLRGA